MFSHNSYGHSNAARVILTVVFSVLINLTVAAQFTQSFEDASNALRTNDCYASASFSATTDNAITGVSARSSQLTNPANPAIYQTPFINFNAGAVLTFDHRINSANGTRNLRVELYSAADNTAATLNNPIVILDYNYSDASLQNAVVPLNVTGVFRIRFVATGSGGSSRVVLDNIQVTNAARSTMGSGAATSSSACNALIPNSTPPTAIDDFIFASTSIPASIDLLANDLQRSFAINRDRVDLNISTSAAQTTLVAPQGTFSVSGGVLTFTPDPVNFTSTFTITYTVKDSAGGTSNTGTVTILLLGPSSSNVSVRGQVVSPNGRPVGRSLVRLIDGETGEVRTAMTNPFGYFNFADVPVGTHIISASGKGLGQTERLVEISDSLDDLLLVLSN